MDKVKAIWQGEMHYLSESDAGTVSLDASEEFGGTGKGVRSKSLMLTSLAGCTGMDISSLVKKMRIPLEGVTIEVTGELTEEHPKTYHTTHIIYTFIGKELDKEKLKRVVDLTYTKYCGVIAMFKQISKVSFEIRYEE